MMKLKYCSRHDPRCPSANTSSCCCHLIWSGIGLKPCNMHMQNKTGRQGHIVPPLRCRLNCDACPSSPQLQWSNDMVAVLHRAHQIAELAHLVRLLFSFCFDSAMIHARSRYSKTRFILMRCEPAVVLLTPHSVPGQIFSDAATTDLHVL